MKNTFVCLITFVFLNLINIDISLAGYNTWSYEVVSNKHMLRYDSDSYGLIIKCDGKARIITVITDNQTRLSDKNSIEINGAMISVDGNFKNQNLTELGNVYHVENVSLSVIDIVVSEKILNKVAEHASTYIDISISHEGKVVAVFKPFILGFNDVIGLFNKTCKL